MIYLESVGQAINIGIGIGIVIALLVMVYLYFLMNVITEEKRKRAALLDERFPGKGVGDYYLLLRK